jgi:RNA polymerase sigma factor (sigma-70 family)
MTRNHWNSSSDEELVREARLGHQEAFDTLVHRFRDAMMAIAQQALGSRETAEDVVQDAFLQALRALPQLHDPARFSHWLGVITRYRARRVGARERRCEPTDSATLDRLLARSGDRPAYPADVSGFTEDEASIRTALSSLPPEYRLVVRLYYYEEWPLRRIAAHLLVPISTVKWRLHHARHLLRRQLAAQAGVEAERDPIGGLRGSHSITKASTGAGIRPRRRLRSQPSARRTGALLAPDGIAERRLRRRSARRLGAARP